MSDQRIGIVMESKRHGEKIAIIDAKDYPLVRGYRWSLQKHRNSFYAHAMVRGLDGSRYFITMHRLILNPGEGVLVDHWDMDGLNNVCTNLRRADTCANGQNRGKNRNNASGFKGVWRRNDNGLYRAKICAHRKMHLLGQFGTAEEAARAYDKAAIRLHGAFARLNFPLEDYLAELPDLLQEVKAA